MVNAQEMSFLKVVFFFKGEQEDSHAGSHWRRQKAEERAIGVLPSGPVVDSDYVLHLKATARWGTPSTALSRFWGILLP